MSSRQREDEYKSEEAEAIAAALDLTLDELNEAEYTIHEIANDDGLVYGYGVEIKRQRNGIKAVKVYWIGGCAKERRESTSEDFKLATNLSAAAILRDRSYQSYSSIGLKGMTSYRVTCTSSAGAFSIGQ
ncbi:hypothetical protein ACVME8_002048 [Bradyrhizobium diazoefficiens]